MSKTQTATSPLTRTICAALAAAGMGLALPAMAQTVEELTVIGRLGPDGELKELSRVVSYADLDLTTRDGEDMLKTRVKDTARDLCQQLGESGGQGALVPSCEQAAQADAMKQVRTLVASAVPRASPVPPAIAADHAPAPEPYAADASASVATPPPSFTTTTVTNGPVADTPENRARFGGPMSRAGRRTAPSGD